MPANDTIQNLFQHMPANETLQIVFQSVPANETILAMPANETYPLE
jgi:hypothetical protein